MMNAIAETANTVTSTSSSFSAHFDFTTIALVVVGIGAVVALVKFLKNRKK